MNKDKDFYSFEQWCIDNGEEGFLPLWNEELNKCKPSEIAFRSNKYCYFECNRKLHKPRRIMLSSLTAAHTKYTPSSLCTACGSFAQNLIDTVGSLDYLSDDNELDPFTIGKGSEKKLLFKCLVDDTHPDYYCMASNFTKGSRCPYCSGRKVCETNSLAYRYPKSVDIWSDKNAKGPNQYTPGSHQIVYWKCNVGKHKNYARQIADQVTYGFSCPECVKEANAGRYREDLTGQKFGRLKVVAFDEAGSAESKTTRWFCDCDCGTKHKSILASHLKSGGIQSCGCYWMEQISGENNYRWKGGVTSERDKARGCHEHKEWSKAVYRRCFYTCQCCGKNKKIVKNAHHLYSFWDHEDLRYDVDNGILLCEECHSHIHKGSFHSIYGNGNNTPEQLEEYINSKRQILGITIPFSIEDYKKGNILTHDAVEENLKFNLKENMDD